MGRLCKNIDLYGLCTEILGSNNYLRFRAKGNSMNPFIMNGEIIKIRPISDSEINVGDIILYHTFSGCMVAHRVIKKCNKSNKIAFVTKGDARLNYDPIVLEDNIIGKVVSVEKPNGIINLDCKPWYILSYVIAKYSLLLFTICKKMHFWKMILMGDNTRYLLPCNAIFHRLLSSFLKLFIKFVLDIQSVKSKFSLF